MLSVPMQGQQIELLYPGFSQAMAGPPVEPQWVTDRSHTQAAGTALSLLSPFPGSPV